MNAKRGETTTVDVFDLFMVLGSGCDSGLLWQVPHRLAAHRRSRQKLRLTLLLYLLH
jgi:hypothetical protein